MKQPIAEKQPKDRLLPRLTMVFFDRIRIAALLWVTLILFGALSYATLLKREGFPSVNIPFAVVSGTYFVNDPAQVDSRVTKPIADAALKQRDTSRVQSESAGNFFSVSIQYEEGVDAQAATKQLERTVNQTNKLPRNARVQYNVPYFGATGGDIEQIDLAISFYSTKDAVPTAQTAAKAEEAAKWLNDRHIAGVKSVFVKNPLEQVKDPANGQAVTVQQNFDRYGIRQNNKTTYYNSVIIGIATEKGTDVIKLDGRVRNALDTLRQQPAFADYGVEVSASFAPSIKDNISELQRVLLEGLLAVLVVGSIVIAIRASLITVVSMVSVLLISLGFLYLIGYTLNVITLFALILGLALIVDDTIIMVEAIDAARRNTKDRRTAVRDATRKISRAMLAATLTACLSFAPLLFVGGILGSFIRAIPLTIIASLIISLFVALIFIPFMARFLLLGKKQMGTEGVKEIAAGFETKVAAFVARPMIWARNSRKKLLGVGITAVLIGFGFITAGLFIAKDVVFNIFPPTKDTNGIVLTLNFPPNTTVEQAEATARQADQIAANSIGDNFVRASYYGSGNAQTATEQIEITSYNKRAVKAPEIVRQLQERFDTDFKGAKVAVGQLDIGPPSSAFIVQVAADNRTAAFNAANDLATFMSKAKLKRPSGKVARFVNTNVSSSDKYITSDGKPVILVTSGFDGTDVSTLVTLGQDAVKQAFPDKRLQGYGLKAGAISFDLGQETENQDSFKTLALAFPALLVVMYVLLAVEFRSFLQPLLIFMAIPFSLFGIMLGLKLTNNAISFFSMLGFFALVGLSIKNTILLTDFANQARRQGMLPVDAAVAALEERFRPLFATSMTAVVSLIPLAVSSPFWEGLAVVLIFGLLSSTLLVVTVFPYYYLGAEFLRLKFTAKAFFVWLIPTAAVVIGVSKVTNTGLGLLVIPLSLALIGLQRFFARRLVRL